MALSGKLGVLYNIAQSVTSGLLTAQGALSKSYDWAIQDGTAASRADLLWSSAGRVLAAGANEDLDLSGVLLGLTGAVTSFVKCKTIGIFAGAANPGNLTVGRGAANGFPWVSAVSAGVVIPPGGWNCWAAPVAGIAVVAATADLVNVAAAATAGSYTYDVVILGTSA